MALVMRRAWRGLIRANLKEALNSLERLFHWDERTTEQAIQLFTTDQLSTLADAEAIILGALEREVPR